MKRYVRSEILTITNIRPGKAFVYIKLNEKENCHHFEILMVKRHFSYENPHCQIPGIYVLSSEIIITRHRIKSEGLSISTGTPLLFLLPLSFSMARDGESLEFLFVPHTCTNELLT